jgi:hypothetical protein
MHTRCQHGNCHRLIKALPLKLMQCSFRCEADGWHNEARLMENLVVVNEVRLDA